MSWMQYGPSNSLHMQRSEFNDRAQVWDGDDESMHEALRGHTE